MKLTKNEQSKGYILDDCSKCGKEHKVHTIQKNICKPCKTSKTGGYFNFFKG